MGIPNQNKKWNEMQAVHHAASILHIHGHHNYTDTYRGKPTPHRQRASRSHNSGIKLVMHRDIPIRISQSLLPSSLPIPIPSRGCGISALTIACVDYARAPIVPATISVAHCRRGRYDGCGSDEARGRWCALAIDGRGVGWSVTVVILAVYDAAAFEVRACWSDIACLGVHSGCWGQGDDCGALSVCRRDEEGW